MARVQLDIDDPVNRLTLDTMLKTAGHAVVEGEGDVMITDDIHGAAADAAERPTLVLASAGAIRDAVAAMGRGVYGYVFLPLQPGEVEEMVRRAGSVRGGPARAPEFEPTTLEEAEFRHIRAVLRHCRGNQAKAARVLGIGRNTLWRKLKKMEDHGETGLA